MAVSQIRLRFSYEIWSHIEVIRSKTAHTPVYASTLNCIYTNNAQLEKYVNVMRLNGASATAATNPNAE